MNQDTQNDLKRFRWPLVLSAAMHVGVLALALKSADSLARTKREPPKKPDPAIMLPVEWVFTPDGNDNGIPGEAGGKAVEEKPMVAKGEAGGVNTPDPPEEPDRTKPHGQTKVTHPEPPKEKDERLPSKPGTVNTPTAPPKDAEQDKDAEGEGKGSPNGQTGQPNGADPNTSGKSDRGGGPSSGVAYGGQGLNGPARSKDAENFGWHGRVNVLVNVSPSGQVISVNVTSSSGFPGLDQECVSRVRSAPFTPAMKDGVQVAGTIDLTCHFPPIE